ncbi:hypothetical protein [Amycolatopsis australiensis]|uniref:Uncharacterized protein n=1 Tax=Amycolatopsis australiensis TaxID=546364 RepID=A0A1K1SUU4_9PSEU|nr:hypothetical protein [Amycolatopsis australiensis]SFW88054.1 hypothetical protein SAMN04489730_6858 [Amycolatopsis australiensis]
MTSGAAFPFVRELNELRRGRGLDAADLHQRIGPCLRASCGITAADQPSAARQKLVLRLTEVCGRLPSDLRLAALAALGLHEEAAGEFLDRRISWLAGVLDRDPRTARRRIDLAFRRLDELLGAPASPRDRHPLAGWYVESAKATLRLDRRPPELQEERRIVAEVDELDELVLSFSVPAEPGSDPAPDITADVLFGGEIVEARQVSASHAQFVMRLPSPLRLGRRHEYGIRFVPRRTTLRPYYVMTPLRRCEEFSVRVRFDRDRPPSRVWRLNGVPGRVIDDGAGSGDALTVNRVGEVGLEFHDLHQGLSYGLQWSAGGPDTGTRNTGPGGGLAPS